MDFEPFPIDDDASEVETEGANNVSVKEFDTHAAHPLPSSAYEPEMKALPSWGRKRKHASSVAEGIAAENEFRTAAQNQGFKVTDPTPGDDFYHRIDIVLEKDGHRILVDVKAMRRTSRSAEQQCEYTWLELHKTGSLFSGKSQVLALQVTDGWLLLDKLQLRTWVLNSFQCSQKRVARANQALMRPYRREGRFPEWISMVRIRDLANAALLQVWAK